MSIKGSKKITTFVTFDIKLEKEEIGNKIRVKGKKLREILKPGRMAHPPSQDTMSGKLRREGAVSQTRKMELTGWFSMCTCAHTLTKGQA